MGRYRSRRRGRPGGLAALGALALLAVAVVAAISSGKAPNWSPAAATLPARGATPATSPAPDAPGPQPTALPTVQPTPTPPSPLGIGDEYLKAWSERRWADMYALLAPSAQATIQQTRFVERYQNIADAATITEIKAKAGTPQAGVLPNTARVPFEATFQTTRLGTFTETNTLPLVYEEGRWGVQWSPSLIFRDLSGDNLIRMFAQNPQRGSILDRQGRPLATQGHIVQVGVVPGEIKDESAVLKALAAYTKVPADEIKKKYASAEPGWFVPIKDLPTAQADDVEKKLGELPGVMLRRKTIRTYPQGEVAANVVGYVSRITAEDLQKLSSKGYGADDYVGRDGIEAWAEEQLSGQRGGRLAVVSPKGEVVKIIAEQEAKRGADVQLTLDVEVQRKAEQTLSEARETERLPGSVVVLDPRDNAILALATYPRFDPNGFVRGLSAAEWEKLSTDPRYPLLNRPALSAYATGSVFKIVPYSAAIEKLGYGPNQPMPCPGSWTIPETNIVVRDLLPQGHGVLPLPEILTESCNVPFYQIGYKLNGLDANLFPSWIRLWGLGQAPGTVGLREAEGIVPDPAWKQKVVGQPWFPGDAVNLGIGQGFFQATPLQMANAYSTLANKGRLRAPLLVRKIATVEGQTLKAYAAEERGQVPISAATYDSILSGLKKTGSTPKGTAYYAFSTFKAVPLASKTGSAENQGPNAHAWFAGYAPADAPEVLVLVMIEGGRAGGTVAAPRGRQMMDFFFPDPSRPPPAATPGANQGPTQPTAPTGAPPAQPVGR